MARRGRNDPGSGDSGQEGKRRRINPAQIAARHILRDTLIRNELTEIGSLLDDAANDCRLHPRRRHGEVAGRTQCP